MKEHLFLATTKKGSIVWNSLCKALHELQDGFQFKVGDGQTNLWFLPWAYKQPISMMVPFVDIHDLNMRISDIWKDGEWQLQMLYTQLPQEVISGILSISPFIVEDIPDTWRWVLDSSGSYSVKSAYRWLLEEGVQMDPQDSWSWLWRTHLPANIQFFMWQFCHLAIPTRDTLASRGISPTKDCPMCSNEDETLVHCLFTCSYAT